MRYLNKVVFIHSAHVSYAEVKLDGNVHFIGTQGVGKSTLLRAILFFYNVDKGKLGIRTQDKQKSYDEFYLPYPNSYIIYEVCRETGKFFVMTFLSRGRTAFRIVDCAYDKRFFVESDGTARHEWGKISEAIGAKVFKSNIIRGYEEFRDIIYGNTQQVDKSLRRFNILESAKYQNVPRTIQNIFLNQSLESRVIKDTIIDSMDFSHDSIDLNFYREHVKDFRQQYDDIWKWFRKDKNGKVKVRTDAGHVVSKYMLHEQCRAAIAELCRSLRYALERDRRLLPQKEKEAEDCRQELARKKRLLGQEEEKHQKEYRKLDREQCLLEDFLRKAEQKRAHYAAIGIERIAALMGREKELKVSVESLKRQESALTDKNRDVESKYASLRKEAENELRECGLQAAQQKISLWADVNAAEERLQAELAEKTATLRVRFQEKWDEMQSLWSELNHQKSEWQFKEQVVRQQNPRQQEMDELAKEVRRLQERHARLAKESDEKKHEMDRIRAEAELRQKDLEAKRDKDLDSMDAEIVRLQVEAAKLDELLGRQRGSFIEWLENHVEGWEDNLGRMLDEEAVLYNTTLHPRLEAASDTLFGIRIDVDNIDRTVRTPEEIKAQREALEVKMANLRARKSSRVQQFQTELAEMQRKPNARLKALRKETMDTDCELLQISALEENTSKRSREIEEQVCEWRKAELETIRKARAQTEEALETLGTQKQRLQTEWKDEENGLRKECEKRRAGVRRNAAQKETDIRGAVEQKKRETEARKKELEALMDAELKGTGVDVGQLAGIRKQLRGVESLLEEIEARRNDYVAWQNDTREYFDHEQAQKEGLKAVKQKLADLVQKFKKRKERLNMDIDQLAAQADALRTVVGKLSDSIARVQQFVGTHSCPPEWKDAEAAENSRPLADLLEELRDHISDRQRRMEEFKQAVVGFKGNFSPQNTFHFRTEFNTDADYMEFAADLNDFVSNNKIEEYRVRTSEQYANIIRRIAREVGDLDANKADIKNTIGEINRDFRENNFAGVIKEIELRAVESNDRLMQLLLNIKKFDDENGLNIGQLNLFSNEEERGRTNQEAVSRLTALMDQMDAERKRDVVTLADTFKLEFKVRENDNDTNWVEKLSNVGSDGTDILVKAMVNIMLINVFKRKISRKFGDFKLHCMMDEVGKLHPNNVEGILKFANVRNIFLINSSPTTYNASAYRYTYALSKDERSNTVVRTLLTIR